MQIKDRIKSYIAHKEISQREFERRIKKSNGYVNNIVNTISADVINDISKEFDDLNINWLITGEEVIIPIAREVREILRKYDYQLPRLISNQKFNKSIKQVCKLAKIDEPISIEETKGKLQLHKTEPNQVFPGKDENIVPAGGIAQIHPAIDFLQRSGQIMHAEFHPYESL